MIFDKKGVKGNNWMHLFFAVVLIVSLVYVMNFAVATTVISLLNITNFTGGHVNSTYAIVNASEKSTTVNDNIMLIYNLTITHTSALSNLTSINLTLPETFAFIPASNRTNATAATVTILFNATSVNGNFNGSVLMWNATSTVGPGWIINMTKATANYTIPFSFNATAYVPGYYNISVRFFYNASFVSGGGSPIYNETNISIVVNDTTKPWEVNLTLQGRFASLTHSNISGSQMINVSALDNGNLTASGRENDVTGVNITILNSSNEINASYTATNLSGKYWNFTLTTTGFPDGVYNISLFVNDTKGNVNSTNITNVLIDNTAPTASAVCSPLTVNAGDVVTCTCSPSDPTSGINSSATSITANPSTPNTGTFTQTCTFADRAGKTGSTTAQYTVEQGGSGASTSSGSSSGSQVPVTSTGETASTESSYTFTTIAPGTPAVKSDFNTDAGVKEISVEVNSEAQDVMVTVTKHDSVPSGVSVAKNGEVYKYLQIETENLDGKLDKATIKVQVEKSWVTDNVADMNDVAVFKFDESGSEWNELGTTYDSEDDTYYYYTVEVDSFSYFAIGEKVVEEEAETTTGTTTGEKSNKIMWIVIAILLLAVLAGGVVWKKRSER